MTHLKNRMTRITAVLLAMLMVLTVAPLIAFPAAAVDNSEFLRIFHLDCGRKYFSVSEIEKIIDELAKNHYTHIELAFGNEGLRFVPNAENMAVGSYSGEKVVDAIAKGNKKYDTDQSLNYTVDSLTEQDMTEIFAYAKSKGIEIIPMLDIPGHMNAVIYAMQALGIDVSVFSYVGTTKPGNIGASFDTTNEAAVAFAKGLVENYITYFAGKGCKYFNIAGDECGFAKMSDDQYTAYAKLMNSLNTKVKAAGMTTLMFNDGVNYKNKNLKDNVSFDKDIIICYWTGGDNYATSTELQAAEYKLINTNVHWYYVAGKEYGNKDSSMFYYNYAINSMAKKKCTVCDGGDAVTNTGCMLAFWCDNPTASVNTTNLYNYIATLANNNPDYFKEAPKPTVTISAQKQILYVGQRTTVSISGATSAVWSIDKTDVLDFSADVKTNDPSVIVEAKKAGIATVTATVDGKEYSVDIVVNNDAIVPAVSEIAEGKSVTLSLASSRAAEWKSSDDSVIKLNTNTSAVATNSITGANSVVAQAVEGAAGKEATVTAAYDGGTAEIKLKVVATRDDPDAVTIELEVGKSRTIENIGSDAEITESGIADIAKAEINSKTVGGSTTYDRASLSAGEFYVSTSSSATNTPTVKLTFEDAGNGQYYIKNASGQYVYHNATRSKGNWSYSLVTTGQQAVTVTQNSTGYITISRSVTSGRNNSTTAYLTLSGTDLDASSSSSRIYLYKENKINGTVQNDIVFTGNGEGSTTYVVGGKTYNVVVTAPTEAVNKTLNYNESFTLPDGSHVVSNSGEGYVTIADNKVTAGTSDISGVEIKIDVKKNGYVIKHYVYTVKVTAVDFSKIADLPIQLWVTNNGIQYDGSDEWSGTTKTTNANGNSRYAYWLPIKASTGNVYSEDGDMLSNVMPASISGVKEWGNVLWDKSFQKQNKVERTDNSTGSMGKDSFDEASRVERNLDLLKGTLLESGSYQLNLGDNRVYSGKDFQYVRYYDNAWWTSADRSSWTKIGTHTVTTSGTTNATGSGGIQIVAYYMYRTDITQEVTTDVVDWGESLPKDSNSVILDFAVKYPDGTTVPGAFPVDGKTLYYNILNSLSYRRLYDIHGLETSGYEIYMITVTPTSDNSSTKLSITADSTPTYSYQGTEKVAWVDDEANLPTKFKDADAKYTSINGAIKYTVGGKPTIKGVEIYSKQGMLVTYYLRPVVTKDSLTVHYRMESSTADFYSYNINVISGTFFKENIGLGDPKIGRLANGDVINDQSVEQWVTSDLSTMPAIGAEYRYANYECVSVVRSEDGKDVYIYYTFKYDASFVIDFGSKLEITPAQVSANLKDANITGLTASGQTYGDITFKGNNIIYTPKTILRGVDRITVTYKGRNLSTNADGSATFNISIIPASTVLYEDDLIEFVEDNWTTAGTSADRTQSTDKLGEKNRYGYDSSYDKDTTYSGGSAHVVTVSAGDPTATARFTFTGTGFDIISLTSQETGVIFVQAVKEDGTKQTWFVDTFYGVKENDDTTKKYIKYTWTKGNDEKWHVKTDFCAELPANTKTGQKVEVTNNSYVVYEYNWTNQNRGELYQIPVMSKTLDYGTYTVTIKVLYSGAFDHLNTGNYDFYIDGVRIYGTLSDSSVYETDGESNPNFTEVRDILIDNNDFGDNGTKPGAVFMDGLNEGGNIDDFKKYGPNNEVYLKPGQGIAFKVTDNGAKLFIGAKAPNGSVTMNINGTTTTINTATDMYYPITVGTDGMVVIANDANSQGILSITTIKSTVAAATYTVDTQVVEYARAMLLEMIQPEVPVFMPEMLDADWSTIKLFRRSIHTLTVRTSDDVDHITVDGKVITNYYYSVTFVGSGWNRRIVKCRVFTLKLGDDARIGDYDIVAFNADGVASEAHTATLTGKTGRGLFN